MKRLNTRFPRHFAACHRALLALYHTQVNR